MEHHHAALCPCRVGSGWGQKGVWVLSRLRPSFQPASKHLITFSEHQGLNTNSCRSKREGRGRAEREGVGGRNQKKLIKQISRERNNGVGGGGGRIK